MFCFLILRSLSFGIFKPLLTDYYEEKNMSDLAFVENFSSSLVY